MQKIGIIVAMGAEMKLLEAVLEDKQVVENRFFRFVRGKAGDREIIAMQSGIGKVCAATGCAEMIRLYAPDYVLNTGVAGGIDRKLRVMDMVVGRDVVYHDVWCGIGNEKGQVQGMPARFPGAPELLAKVRAVESEVALYEGLICTGDQFITDRVDLDRIKADFPEGLAVDMESGAIAQVCYMYGVPFLSLRVISDTPGMVENHALQYRNFWETAPEKTFEVLKQMI